MQGQQGLLATRGHGDVAAQRVEKGAHDGAHFGFVLDQQHPQALRHLLACAGVVVDCRRVGSAGAGNVEREGGSDAGQAVDGDRAFGLLDEPVHRAQAEAGAATGFFGCEERLEGAFLHLVGHAAAGVGDRNRDEALDRCARRVGFIANTVRQSGTSFGSKTQAATLGHRIAGIDRDVQQGRLELPRVGQHRRAGRRHLDLDADALVECASQHVGQ